MNGPLSCLYLKVILRQCLYVFSETFVWSGGGDVGSLPIPAGSNIWAISPRQNWIQDWILIIFKKHHCRHYHRKNQIVVKNLRIVAQWWTSSEGHLLRLYFGVFQPSVVSSNMLNAVAQRPYEHSLWQCLRGYQGFHVTWIMVMNIHISTTGSSTSTCDRRAVEQPVCEDDKIYVQHQLCLSGRQTLCASHWLMTGLHCGTIVHIIGDEQRTYLVVKGTDRNRALRLSRANGWHGDSEILMLCNSRISVLIRIKEELHSTILY